MDTTSLSFHGAGGDSLGAYGHSKDHRADLKEMILAVVIDGEGWPICTEMLPGNTADAIVLLPVVDRLRERFHIGRVCIDQLWLRVPGYKPLSVGIVLLDLVPAGQHQPDLFAADNRKRQKLSPLVDRINYRCTIGFGLLPPEVRAFKGHAAFQRVPESWEF